VGTPSRVLLSSDPSWGRKIGGRGKCGKKQIFSLVFSPREGKEKKKEGEGKGGTRWNCVAALPRRASEEEREKGRREPPLFKISPNARASGIGGGGKKKGKRERGGVSSQLFSFPKEKKEKEVKGE